MRSLVLNIMVAKLTNILSLKTKLIMSKNGEHIFVLVKADDSDIATTAMKFRYNAQLEIGYTDLSSLEPCNDRLRQFKNLKKPDSELGESILKKEFQLRNFYAFIDMEREFLEESELDRIVLEQDEINDKIKIQVENTVDILQWETYDRI
jgi:hypothetical protein